MYRLNQALKAWYSRIGGYFLKNKFVKCLREYTLYIKIKESGDTLIVYFYMNDFIFIRNNSKMIRDFKQTMIKKFEMTGISLIIYYLGIEIK